MQVNFVSNLGLVHVGSSQVKAVRVDLNWHHVFLVPVDDVEARIVLGVAGNSAADEEGAEGISRAVSDV